MSSGLPSTEAAAGPAPSPIRLRLLAAATGSLVSAAAALVTAPTIVLGIVGLVGIPVGAIIGFAVGPRLAREPSAGPTVFKSSIVAVLLGVGIYTLFAGVAQGRGATLLEVAGMALMFGAYALLYALLIGLPMALVVAAVAAQVFRRLAGRADRLWIPAAAIVLIVATVTIGGLVAVSMNAGDEAARQGDSVHFTYRVDNLSSEPRMLDVRSFWKGTESGGSSSEVGVGPCTAWGDDWLQQSDWAIWLSPANAEWVDRPSGDPIITSAQYGQRGSVELTIVINPDGSAAATAGTPAACEP